MEAEDGLQRARAAGGGGGSSGEVNRTEVERSAQQLTLTLAPRFAS